MKNFDFKFNKEGVTLEWQQEGSRVGYIRVHKDKVPGKVTHSGIVEAYPDGSFELKIFKREDEESSPFRDKLTPLTQYLYSIGYTKGGWCRQDGKIKEIQLTGRYLTDENPEE
jgi:hypothetical protein